MIRLTGNVLIGLDEFMLRLGHLKVLCSVSAATGPRWHRIRKEASEKLTSPVSVTVDSSPEVVSYLIHKKLCAVGQGNGAKASKVRKTVRYPEILVARREDKDSTEFVISQDKVSIWWQDFCLADERVISKVGGITVAGKSGSKTGLSHIEDWAQEVGLLSRTGEVSAIARVITGTFDSSGTELNPYVIGPERIGLAYQILRADADCFSRFILRLQSVQWPIRKAEATEIFASVVSSLADEAKESRDVSELRRGQIYGLLRDLKNAARQGKKEIHKTSTAWHRTSSRLETYVDLGILSKGTGGEQEAFEYIYYPTPAFQRTITSLKESTDLQEWLEEQLVGALIGDSSADFTITESREWAWLLTVIRALARPVGPQPIEAISIGLASLAAAEGAAVSIASARRALEALAIEAPELARLSRGGVGNRAEFISFDARRLEAFATS